MQRGNIKKEIDTDMAAAVAAAAAAITLLLF